MGNPLNISVSVTVGVFIGIIILVGVDDTSLVELNPFSFNPDYPFEPVSTGQNDAEPTLLFAESWIETKTFYPDRITSSKTGKIENRFLSLVTEDTKLKPIVKTEMFVYTDFGKLGSDFEFDFPRTTIKQYVTVNGIPVNTYKQLQLANEFNENTGILKGAGISIDPTFVETIIGQSQPLQSGDVIEIIIEVSGRYNVVNTVTEKVYDGYIEGLNNSIVYRYYDPDDLLLIIAGVIENPIEETSSGCPDENNNDICDSNEPNQITQQTADDTVTTESVDSESPVDSQTSVSGESGEPIFDDTITEEQVDTDGDGVPDSTLYSSPDTSLGENPSGSGGVNVACDSTQLDCDEVVNTIVNEVQQQNEAQDNLSFLVIVSVIIVLVSSVVFVLIRRVRK